MIDVRKRLVKALHTSTTLPQLREALIELACELEDVQGAPTLRSIATDAGGHNDDAPETEPDSAPPTPVDSAVGQEFGI